MSDAVDFRPVLRAYPADCQPRAIEYLAGAGGFSGAQLWRLQTARGPLVLRRFSAEHPTRERLEFIQAVLWHVQQEGFERVPLPLETSAQHGYVRHADRLWELVPWLPGAADYGQSPTVGKLRAALVALAEFHGAAASFPLPDAPLTTSPGIAERLAQLQTLCGGGFAALRAAPAPAEDPFVAARGAIESWFPQLAPRVRVLLAQAAQIKVPLAPCLRDIWHENVLFVGDEVSGLIDFGAMRPENVAADVARLLGSMAENDPQLWQQGLAAYEARRPLTEAEAVLVTAFDASGVLLGAVNWLVWLYQDRRHFDRPERVLARLDYFCRRLRALA